MSDQVSGLFTDSEREAVRQATARAEARTSGEIVSYLVPRSDEYPEAPWQAAALGALVAALATAVVYGTLELWGVPPVLWTAFPALAGATAGYLLGTYVGPLRRLLAGGERMAERVRERAGLAFLEEEVFKTRDRTGILIFLSLFEHRATILADEGIHKQVEEAEWQEIADRLAGGIRAGRAAEALVETIEGCGRLLEERGVAIAADDTDELGNELRMRDA